MQKQHCGALATVLFLALVLCHVGMSSTTVQAAAEAPKPLKQLLSLEGVERAIERMKDNLRNHHNARMGQGSADDDPELVECTDGECRRKVEDVETVLAAVSGKRRRSDSEAFGIGRDLGAMLAAGRQQATHDDRRKKEGGGERKMLTGVRKGAAARRQELEQLEQQLAQTEALWNQQGLQQELQRRRDVHADRMS